MHEPAPRHPHGAVAADYLFATTVTLAAFALTFVADRYLSIANLSLILLTGVLAVAVRKRMAVAVYTAVLCFLGYNFFFTRPRYTLAIANGDDVLAIVLFLIVALVCSRMATRLSDQVTSLRTAQQRARTLLQLGRELATAAGATAIREVGARALTKAVGATAHINPAEEASAVDRNDDPGCGWLVPLTVGAHGHGTVVFATRGPDEPDAERRELAIAMSQDIALALERARLAHELEQARVQGETERLRNALLSSVSHDLRSPLASMIGAADTLAMY